MKYPILTDEGNQLGELITDAFIAEGSKLTLTAGEHVIELGTIGKKEKD